MSKRITRSQTVCLDKAPTYTFPINGIRKPRSSKKSCQHLTQSQRVLNKDSSGDQSPEPGKTKVAVVKKTPAKEKPPQSKRKVEATSEMPRRLTRSKTIGPSEAPVIALPVIGKRKSAPTKKFLQYLASKSTVNKSTTRSQSPEAKRSSDNSSKRGSIETGSKMGVTVGKEKSTAKVVESVNVRKTKDSQTHSHEAQPIENAQFLEQPTPATSNIVLRRSTRLTRDVISKGQSEITTKVANRRHTISSIKTTTNGNTASASNRDKRKSIDASNAKKVSTTSEAKGREKGQNSSTKAVKVNERRKSSADPNTTRRSVKIQPNQNTDFTISDDLKKILVDDANFIIVQKKLNEIPHGLSVAEVVQNYATIIFEENTFNSSPMTINILFAGIIEYFDSLIGRQLLYEQERVQYLTLLNNYPGVPMSKVYTPIYLLRLLVKLNQLLHYRQMLSGEALTYSIDHVNKFLMYLSDNKSAIFNISQ